MATQEIVQSLAYVSWVLIGGTALGSLALCWLLRLMTDATRGFLGFTALLSALLGGLWLVVDVSLPPPDELVIRAAPGLDGPRGVSVAIFTLLALLSSIGWLRGGSPRLTAPGALLSGLAALLLAALGWAPEPGLVLPLLVQLVSLTSATGAALGAVVLAHWYLVTPRLSERPLVLATGLLTWVLFLQLLLLAAWQVVGIPEGPPFAALTGAGALFAWLRLTIGLLFPLILAYLAHRTALTRSMESATGLLYISLTAVLASTIVAAALAVSVGLLV